MSLLVLHDLNISGFEAVEPFCVYRNEIERKGDYQVLILGCYVAPTEAEILGALARRTRDFLDRGVEATAEPRNSIENILRRFDPRTVEEILKKRENVAAYFHRCLQNVERSLPLRSESGHYLLLKEGVLERTLWEEELPEGASRDSIWYRYQLLHAPEGSNILRQRLLCRLGLSPSYVLPPLRQIVSLMKNRTDSSQTLYVDPFDYNADLLAKTLSLVYGIDEKRRLGEGTKVLDLLRAYLPFHPVISAAKVPDLSAQVLEDTVTYLLISLLNQEERRIVIPVTVMITPGGEGNQGAGRKVEKRRRGDIN